MKESYLPFQIGMGSSTDSYLPSCALGTMAQCLKALESVIWDVKPLKVFIEAKFYKSPKDRNKLPLAQHTSSARAQPCFKPKKTS